jgi:hypothetical protein
MKQFFFFWACVLDELLETAKAAQPIYPIFSFFSLSLSLSLSLSFFYNKSKILLGFVFCSWEDG